MKLRKLFLTVLAGAALLMACDKKEVDLGPAKLTVNPTDVAFEQDMDSKDISLVATRDWAVTGLPDWIALSKESGAANPDAQKVVISVTQNEGYNRSATLTFSIGFARSVLHVSQAGPDGEVDNGDGSKTNPYNVEGVIAFVTALGDKESENNVYVKGKISAISEEYSTQYGNGAFTISDDGTTESPQFTAYRVLYLGNKKFASGDTQIQVGDDVILYGKVVNYKGNTPETAQGAAFLFSLNGVDKGGDGGQGGEGTPKGTGTLEDPYNPAGIAAVAAALADNAVSTESYYMKGKISKIAVSKNVDQTFANSGDYGNASFYITDSEDATGEFYIYQTYYLGNRKWVTGDTDIKVGDEVIVYGPVTKYVSSYGTTLETSGKGASYIYSLNGTTGSDTPPTPVVEPKGTGTKDDPFNVAAAIVKAKETGETVTADEYYIKGIVATVSLSAEHKNADLNLVDVENGEVFKAFRIKGFEGADITGTEPIKKGDVVVICGKIVNFKGNTPETDQGGKLITWNDKTSFDGQGGGGGVPAGDSYVLDKDAIKAAHTEAWSYTSGEKKVKATDGSEWTLVNTYASKDQVTVQMNKGKGSYVLTPAAPEGKVVKKISVVLNKAAKGDGEMGDRPIDILSADGATTLLDDVTGQTLADGLEVPAGNAQVKIICDETNGGAVYITSITVTFTDGEGGGQGGEGGGGEGGDTPAKPVNEGTLESPYTVADALIAAKDADLTGKEYYVKAIVGKDIAIKNGTASFELMDGTTDGKLTVVKAKSFKGAAFDGNEALDWLDEVILKGTVTEYSTLPALTDGEFILWNGKKTFKGPETNLAKVIAAADNADVYFTAVVSAVTTNSFVVTDGTNNFYVFKPATMAAIGDKVTVSGVKTTYGGIVETSQGAEVEVVETGKTVEYTVADDITASFDAYPASNTGKTSDYVTFTGKLVKSGNFYNVEVEGATTYKGSVSNPIAALGLDALVDKTVDFTGYYVGTNKSGNNNFINFVCTKAVEFVEDPKEPFEIVFTSAAAVTSEGVTVTCTKGSGSTAPAWNENSSELRLYAKNVIKVASAEDIAKIDFYFHKQGSKAFQSISMTSTEGTYTDCAASTSATDSKIATWEGTSKLVELTLGDASGGQRVLEKVVITLK